MTDGPSSNERRIYHDGQPPPPYTAVPTPRYNRPLGSAPPQNTSQFHTTTNEQTGIGTCLPFVPESPQASSPCIHSPPIDRDTSASSSSSKAQSRWQQLKQENEERKAKNQFVTHEQAAMMSGHDRRGFRLYEDRDGEFREQWEREVTRRQHGGYDDRLCCVM